MMRTARLLLHCPDKPGILVGVVDSITANKGSTIYLDQYVDHVENIFFMYIEWELEDSLVPQEKIEDYFETLHVQRYGMSFRPHLSDIKPRMATFISKMSHCPFDLLAYYTAGGWNVEISPMISNRPDLQYVAERFGISFHLFPITKETKGEQEKKEMELLTKYKVSFIALARYIQVISKKMINAYPNRVINIHHSSPPTFAGVKPYHAALERGIKIIGVIGHYVITEPDTGSIIEQDVMYIAHKDTVQDLVNKDKDLEKTTLSRAVQKYIERRVLAYKSKTVILNQQLMRVVAIRYNVGNIQSMDYALRRLGVEAEVTADETVLRAAGKVIFPGVGEMEMTMSSLNGGNMGQLIKELRQPALGACLGMQLIRRHLEEGDVDCLGIFDVDVKRPVPQKHEDKMPHMGWSTITQTNSGLFKGFTKEKFVYFTHSFYVPVNDCTTAVTNYVPPSSAALHKDNYYVTQPHPEKSGSVGKRIL